MGDRTWCRQRDLERPYRNRKVCWRATQVRMVAERGCRWKSVRNQVGWYLQLVVLKDTGIPAKPGPLQTVSSHCLQREDIMELKAAFKYVCILSLSCAGTIAVAEPTSISMTKNNQNDKFEVVLDDKNAGR